MGTNQDFERLHELIKAYVNDRCTKAERFEVEQWYEQLGTDDAGIVGEEVAVLRTQIFSAVLAGKQDQPAKPNHPPLGSKRGGFYNKRLLAIAAIFLLMVGVATIVYLFNTGPQASVATTFGKTDTVFLPDNSAVVLNANSSIRYAKRWKKDEPREVWLKGEALFMVTDLRRGETARKGDHFLVHVKNATVEVLGTVFNVRERRGKTEIVLQRGLIKVSFKHGSNSVTLRPGQMVIVDTAGKNITHTSTKAEDYTAWTSKKLILADPTLQNIVEYLEDNYGKQIILSEPGLAERRIGGTLMIDNLDDALFILSKTLDLTITTEGDRLYISPR